MFQEGFQNESQEGFQKSQAGIQKDEKEQEEFQEGSEAGIQEKFQKQEEQEPLVLDEQELWIVPQSSYFFSNRKRKAVPNPKFFRNLIIETTKCAEDLKQKEFEF